jgi:hypothetical protein
MARTPTAIRKQALFGIATVNSFGRAKPIVFDERVLAPEARSRHRQVTNRYAFRYFKHD